MARTLLYAILVLISTSIYAQTPIPRSGNDCPRGYYQAGDYCQPIKSTDNTEVITKQGKGCPRGYYQAGNYCREVSESEREAVPRESGKDCPRGWYKAGEYCVEQR